MLKAHEIDESGKCDGGSKSMNFPSHVKTKAWGMHTHNKLTTLWFPPSPTRELEPGSVQTALRRAPNRVRGATIPVLERCIDIVVFLECHAHKESSHSPRNTHHALDVKAHPPWRAFHSYRTWYIIQHTRARNRTKAYINRGRDTITMFSVHTFSLAASWHRQHCATRAPNPCLL